MEIAKHWTRSFDISARVPPGTGLAARNRCPYPRRSFRYPSSRSTHAFDARLDLGARSHMIYTLRRGALHDQLSIPWSETPVAFGNHPVTAHGAAPERAVLRPARWWLEQPHDQPLRDPQVMGDERKINEHKGIRRRESLPGGGDAPESIDDPFVAPQELVVNPQILVMRDLAAAGTELDHVDDIQRQPSGRRQPPGERGFPASRVAEHRHPPHDHLRGPRCILEHHAVAVYILEGPPVHIPIWVVRWDASKPGRQHPGAALLPLHSVGNVEDEEMVLGGRRADAVAALPGELEVVRMLGTSEDHAVEAVVIRELRQDHEPQSPFVYGSHGGQVVGWSGNAKNVGRAHSMRRSARNRSDGGIVRPMFLAVRLLITSSNVDGCSTGRSPGFAPFKILST